jgi:hypothetical protein
MHHKQSTKQNGVIVDIAFLVVIRLLSSTEMQACNHEARSVGITKQPTACRHFRCLRQYNKPTFRPYQLLVQTRYVPAK